MSKIEADLEAFSDNEEGMDANKPDETGATKGKGKARPSTASPRKRKSATPTSDGSEANRKPVQRRSAEVKVETLTADDSIGQRDDPGMACPNCSVSHEYSSSLVLARCSSILMTPMS